MKKYINPYIFLFLNFLIPYDILFLLHMNLIKTDGVGCSVLLVKLKEDGTPVYINSAIQKRIKEQIKQQEKYIENIEITDEVRSKKIVVADPNEADLIYCLSKDEKGNNITFRYTQNQRRLETRNKKYNKITDTINKETKINEKNVKELENKIEKSSKSYQYDKFLTYCISKNKVNSVLFEHYQQKLFRKLKFNRYTNTQKSEHKMITNFENKYGKPNECIIVIGDYDKTEHRKGKEPTICRRIKKIFRQYGYDVYLINEFRTSKLCNHCEEECEKFLMRPSKKPRHVKSGKQLLCHGLVQCQSVNCKLIHNRDKNATLNMYKIVMEILAGRGRPVKYCRENKNNSTSFALNDAI